MKRAVLAVASVLSLLAVAAPAAAHGPHDVVVVFDPPRTPEMSRARLAALVRRVERLSFDSARLDILRSVARREHVTVAQLGRLLDTLSFDANRVATAEAFAQHRGVVDPENAFELARHFVFDANAARAVAAFDRRACDD